MYNANIIFVSNLPLGREKEIALELELNRAFDKKIGISYEVHYVEWNPKSSDNFKKVTTLKDQMSLNYVIFLENFGNINPIKPIIDIILENSKVKIRPIFFEVENGCDTTYLSGHIEYWKSDDFSFIFNHISQAILNAIKDKIQN